MNNQKMPIYALYDQHEMSKPQLMRIIYNVAESEYYRQLSGVSYINISCVTTIETVKWDAVVLVFSSAVCKKLLGDSKRFQDKQNKSRGSIFQVTGTNGNKITLITEPAVNIMKLLLISNPKDDSQEKLFISNYYAFANDLYKAVKFASGEFVYQPFEETFHYQLISKKEEWYEVQQKIIKDSSSITAIAFDIETAGYPTFISAFGFTLVYTDGTLLSYCIAMGVHDYVWHHDAMSWICSLDVPKIAHNASYDCDVLLRYRIPVRNILFDTFLMQHALNPDALHSLAYCASTMLPSYIFWKSEIHGIEGISGANSTEDIDDDTEGHGVPATPEGRLVYYKYCAKDTYYTARICKAMLAEMKSKPWAVENYCLVHFLQIRVGMFMGYAGMPIDMNRFNKWVDEVIATKEELLDKLRDWSGDQLFNPNSVAELQYFFYVKLGMPLPVGIRLKAEKEKKGKVKSAPAPMVYDPLADFDDSMFVTDTELTESTAKVPEVPIDLDRYPTDKTAIKFLMEQNPQHREKLQTLVDYRWYNKVISNYLSKPNLLVRSRTDKNVKVLLYHPSIASTVTCRYGGKDHNLRCGAYHLNLPPGLWKCIKIPEGYVRYSIDYSHSDDYFVAFYSGCKPMMDNVVRTDLDLHMKHASLIFQQPYEELMAHKKDPNHVAGALRKITKSIGHGCKYMMGAYTMFTHMGEPAVVEAAHHLGKDLTRASLDDKISFAGKLQQLFYDQYPGLTDWHKDAVMALLRNPARLIKVGKWTRQLLKPANWFSTRSGTVAQYGQAGTSSNSNQFLLKFFRQPLRPRSYIFAQVHDAMDGFAVGEEEVKRIAKMMEEPITVTDLYGATRTFTVATETELFKPDTKGE